jgi:hypothetical protein
LRHTYLVAFLAAAVVAAACGSGGGDSSNNTDKKDTADATTAAAKTGQPARDGKFEFTVQKVKCGVHTVGDSTFGE